MKSISNADSILDIGCGEGSLMKDLIQYRPLWKVTGIELYEDSLKNAREKNIYTKVLKGNVVHIENRFKSKSVDVVFSSQVVEHLKKDEAIKALKEWEHFAKKRIVITTIVGFFEYNPIEKEKDKNPLQAHKSAWSIEEFKQMGYKVHGQGLKYIYGEKGIAHKYPFFLHWFTYIAFCFAPICYFFPSLSTYMIAVKEIKNEY